MVIVISSTEIMTFDGIGSTRLMLRLIFSSSSNTLSLTMAIETTIRSGLSYSALKLLISLSPVKYKMHTL